MMKDIHRTTSGRVWREVETVEEAMQIGEVTLTAFGYIYRGDFPGVGDNRYFSLGDDSVVIGCVPRNPNKDPIPAFGRGLPLFVGHRNVNPFPEHAEQIQELAEALGVEITATHYPYPRPVSEDADGPAP